MQFNVGVIGATGYIATPYRAEMREATDDARIVALCARRREPLEAAAREDGAEFVTDDWREVIDHPEVDFVMITTPDKLHHEPAMAAAAAGKHLFVDKPVSGSAADTYEIWSAYRDAQLAHFVPFWSRYVGAFARARQIVADGVLGEIRGVIYRWQNPRPAGMPFTWRDNAELSAGGSIADVGSHAYDTVRWVTGLEARRVLTHAGVITPPKPDLGTPNLEEALSWGLGHDAAAAGEVARRKGTAYDFADVAVDYGNDVIGSFVLSHSTYLRKGLAPDLELHGTEGSLGIDRTANEMRLVRPDEPPELMPNVDDAGFGNRFAEYVFPSLRAQIAGEPGDHPDLEDGWRVQMFTDAAAASAERGAWVETAEFDASASG